MYEVWEVLLMEKLKEYNDITEHVYFEMFTQAAIRKAFGDDIRADLKLVQIAIGLVGVYTCMMLGTFSGMHCRLVVSLMGLFCVGLSYAAGSGICFYLGGKTAGVHSLLPFLLIGIGVDDMFVICNAVDQTDLRAPAKERIIKALQHAGPSITITSLTNALAFFFGGVNSLTALRSFCIFAGACIIMLYFIVMSVFLCVVVWDTERVGRKKGECCGLFCCKMDSIICCKGFFLSPKQLSYGTVEVDEKNIERSSDADIIDPAIASTKTEKCIEMYLAPAVLSNIGRIIILVVYFILLALAIFGASQVRIDFKVTFFIGETADVYGYFQENDRYFSVGSFTTIYVDND